MNDHQGAVIHSTNEPPARQNIAELRPSRRQVLAGLGASIVGACTTTPDGANEGASEVGRIGTLAAIDWASRAEVTPYEIPNVVAPHYAEAGTALGVARLAEALNKPELLELVRARWDKARTMINTANHVDANVIGVWALAAGGIENIRRGLELADGQWNEVDQTGLTRQARFWIDDVYMIGALQAQAWRATGDPKYVDRAALMATQYLDRLQQPNGLFHHGLETPFFWGRGNGWVAAGLAEVLSVLTPEHAGYGQIAEGFGRMAQALLRTQREDGLWGQLIDYPEAWSETSGSAMFGYSFVRGANLGFLRQSTYRQAALRAWSGLAARVEPDGKLQTVCVGTGQADNAQFYLERPTVTGDLHGQAPLLWLSAELARK